ncbi:glycosyltransferase family 4 protein [Cohaesibacter sp. CAU 1516]|uniref:glycosyltransferase family 4 protein n=1 Tax=Cohaesibacter sp. CAU 1516 TaxID=2576038 RepID=UPI0010FF10FF|nr:glycosyltransferase family 4 protein [Cohaesibacter sp. CAU 1516]TLP44854.1 glycosyltransferase family 4 protein [Cohaesibacter sp. CAU 1516]
MHKDVMANEQAAHRPSLLFFAPDRADAALAEAAYMLYLDELLDAQQFDITIIAPNGSRLADRARAEGLTLHPLSDFARKLLMRTPQLWPILTAMRRWRYDIALTHEGYACRGLGVIARKVVGICHDDQVERFSAANQIIVLNSGIADLAKDLIEDGPPIEVLPYPYDCRFDSVKTLPDEQTPLRIGTSAPFLEGDGLGVFIHMAQLLKQSHPEIHFVVAGNGPTEHDMKELADHIAPFIEFVGVASSYELANSIDLFCLTSRDTAYSLDLCSMMDAGLACVATCTNGAMDILKGGMVAPLVPIDDGFMLAVQLQELLDDRAHIYRIKKACYERIREEDFSRSHFSYRLQNLLLSRSGR